MEILLNLFTALLLTMTLLPLSRSNVWWVRVFDFPRFQLLIAAIILATLELALTDLKSSKGLTGLLITLACLIYQFVWIYPYTRLARKEVAWAEPSGKGETLTLVCANVLTPNKEAKKLITLLEKCSPDVILTLESNDWWQQQLSTIENQYTYSIKIPLDNLYGMHLYSKFPIQDAEISFLLKEDIPSIHCKILLPSGNLVRCHFLHPAPPVPEYSNSSGERDAELIAVAKSVSNETMPVIVAGDLNDVAWSTTTRLFRKTSRLLDPRVGRGLINTFHADYWFLRWPLDHLFHSHHFTVKKLHRLPKFGSDHFALFTELVLEPNSRNRNDSALTKSQADDLEVKNILDKQPVEAADVPR
ncbi:MAG: endonuclease/exonuclease/phosphatase family protein [Pseudohongiellaceae bacterium]